jgi:outer membrane immunogenic protein
MRIMLVSAIALAVATPAAAQTNSDTNSYDGFRAEARLGYETPTVSEDEDIYKLGSAVSYGGEIGFDIAVSPTVTVGPYVSAEESSVELEEEGTTATIEIGRNYQVGGRIGFGLGGLVGYGKLGYSNIKLNLEGTGDDYSATKGGVGGGLGIEGNLGRNAYWGVEGNYSDFGRFEGVNLQRRQVAAKFGVRL